MPIKITTFILSISICFSLSSHEFNSQQGNCIDVNAPFPGNYTLREIVSTEYTNQKLLLSPDQNWIIYQSSDPTSYSTTFYFRLRTSLDSKSLKLGIKKLDDIISMAFNQKGDLLFIGTFYGIIYMCKFWQNMTNQDCEVRFETHIEGSYYQFSINQANLVAICLLYEVRVLKLSETGQLIQVARKTCNVIRCEDIEWHPTLPDMLIIGSCNELSRYNGQISFFNISSNQTILDNPTDCVKRFVVFQTTNIIISRNYFYALNAYVYEQNNITQIQINKDIKMANIQLSKNEALLTSPTRGVFTVSFSTNPITNVQLNQVYSINSSLVDSLIFSDDGNQFISSDSYRSKIQIFSMCPPRTYYSLQGCLSCNQNCYTCHFNSNICTNCLKNNFVLDNQTCLPCSNYLPGCLTCSNTQLCVSCDKKNNWNPLPKNGSCVCQDFYFISQGQCKSCDSSGACRTCTSQSQCTQCDLYKGYKEKPVDSKCVCRRQFSSVNQKCVECDIEGCERCEKANVCLSCSEENGYESDVRMDGACVKKNSYSIVIILSISGGLLFIFVVVNYVYCKCKGKRNFQRNELKEESYIEDQSYKQILSGGSMDHKRVSVRESVPRFEQIEQILRQSIKKQIKVEVPIAAVNKKEYAKFSDEQKIRLRQLLQQSLVSNR